ncbi:MAG: tetratricopeptide repeat protein [Treponema sp.]|nr:tetratricopeptide repeat protein [Treponema sp.]
MSNNSLLISRARAALMARDFNLAARLYKQLLRDEPDNIEFLNKLGELYMKSGRDDQALPIYKRIGELNRDDAKPYITMGGIYRRLKRYEESIAVLEQALAADGTNPQISYNLGFTYKTMGDYEDAINCFEDAIDMNPNDVLAYNHLGAIYAQQGDHEKAVQSYLRGLNIDANHPVLLLNIAKSYEALGDIDKALSSYEGALRSKPLWADAIDSYTKLLIKTNRADEAYLLVRRAINVSPKDKKLQDALATVEKYVDKDSLQEKVEQMPALEMPEPVQTDDDDMANFDEHEFDAGGLEIAMPTDELNEFEEGEAADDADSTGGGEEKTEEMQDGDRQNADEFDFESMGMDVLKDDEPLDPLFFEESDANLEDDTKIQNLDDLLDENDAPVDTNEGEPYKADDDYGFTDEDVGDSDFENPGNDLQKINEDEPVQSADEFPADEPETPLSSEPDAGAADEETLPVDMDEYKKLSDDLAGQVQQAKDTLEKANYAAERAWNAAQQAADAAQAIDAAQSLSRSDDEVPEDDIIEEAEDAEEEENPDALFANEDDSMDPDEVDVTPFTDDELNTHDPYMYGQDKESLEQFKKELEMFKKLKEMLTFLPEEKRNAFFSSKTRILLDYIITRLSGAPGLCKTADSMIENGSVTAWSGDNSTAKEGDELVHEVFGIMENLAGQIADESLRSAMLKELSVYNS